MLDDLIQANRRYAADFTLRGIPAGAAKGFALVTCMDSRIEPLTMLGLQPGDAKILRNAGARVTPDVLRSLILATTLLGVTEIAVMQHTACALAHRRDDDLREKMPNVAGVDLQEWDFLAMLHPDQALAADVDAVRSCTALPAGVLVEGWRYDVETGGIVRLIT